MNQRVQTVMSLMEAGSHCGFALGEMAESANLSSWHFCRLFKAETGTSPVQYLRSLRMQKAKLLLETSLLSVKEVMAQVGIRDQSHFVRDFKSNFGLTPAQYRARYWAINLGGGDPDEANSKIRQ